MQETREKLLSNMKILMNQAAQLEWGIFQQITDRLSWEEVSISN